MEAKELINNLCQESISSKFALYYRKEINKIYSDCFNKARFFKKTGLFPKNKDNNHLMETVLELKNLQLNNEANIKEHNIDLVHHFLKSADINYSVTNKTIKLDEENQRKLANHFQTLETKQLSFIYSFNNNYSYSR